MKSESCIFFQLAKASQSATRYWSSRVESLGVTAVQAMVLNFLREGDGLQSRELGSKTGLDSATLTGILDRLEKMELVERRRNPEDRRAINIYLTEEGKDLVPEIESLMESANKDFLKGLKASEAETLRKALVELRGFSGEQAGR